MANSLSYQEEKKSAAGYLQYKENVGKLDRSSEMKKKKKVFFKLREKQGGHRHKTISPIYYRAHFRWTKSLV